MKKIVVGFAFFLCLIMGSYASQSPAKAAVKWNENKVITVKKGAFTFKAHPAKNKKQAWIYLVKVNPKKGSTKTLKFPAKIKGRKVTKLGYTEDLGTDTEFYKNIFNVWIEEAHGCDGYRTSLKKIKNMVIPKTVKEFTNCCFSGMRALKKVTIPSGVKVLPRSCFYGCKKLKTVTLPKKMQEFDREVFEDCKVLSTMKIAKSNKYFKIKNGAVLSKNEKHLYWVLPTKKKYTISTKVKSIDGSAFEASKVKSLTIPASVTDLKTWALYSKKLKNVTVDANNPVYAKDGQCIYKKATGELIAAIVKDNKITISSKVTVLNNNATMTGADVYDEIERVDIPASVKTLVTGWMFFHNLETKVYFHAATPPQIDALVPGWQHAALPCFNPVYVPKGSETAYENWAKEHFRFDKNDVKSMGFDKLYTF